MYANKLDFKKAWNQVKDGAQWAKIKSTAFAVPILTAI